MDLTRKNHTQGTHMYQDIEPHCSVGEQNFHILKLIRKPIDSTFQKHEKHTSRKINSIPPIRSICSTRKTGELVAIDASSGT